MKFIAWLKSLFIHPKEKTEMTEATAAAVPATDTTTAAVAADPTPAQEVSAGVNDLKAALNFIKSGISHLGEAAEDELAALAQKYL